jgi:hypothetical protein
MAHICIVQEKHIFSGRRTETVANGNDEIIDIDFKYQLLHSTIRSPSLLGNVIL